MDSAHVHHSEQEQRPQLRTRCVKERQAAASAPEALLLHHVYGTNGLVLELEVGLAPAHPWLEAIVSFDSFDAAIEFADALAAIDPDALTPREALDLYAPILEACIVRANMIPAG